MTPASPLERASLGLRQAGLAMQAGELDSMLDALTRALDALAELAHGGQVPDPPPRTLPPWDGDQALQVCWQVLAHLRAAGCGAFPHAGTLLGLERDGALLPHDKDADIGVWTEDFHTACIAMQSLGFQRATNLPPFSNLASFVLPSVQLSVDLFAMQRMPGAARVVGGVWMQGKPESHQRISHYPWFTLTARTSPAGDIGWPDPVVPLLAAMYGDWRTPQPEWDAHISNPAVQALNLHWRCWSLQRLCDAWIGGDVARTRRVLEQITARAGMDAQLLRYQHALDGVLRRLASTGR